MYSYPCWNNTDWQPGRDGPRSAYTHYDQLDGRRDDRAVCPRTGWPVLRARLICSDILIQLADQPSLYSGEYLVQKYFSILVRSSVLLLFYFLNSFTKPVGFKLDRTLRFCDKNLIIFNSTYIWCNRIEKTQFLLNIAK